MTIRVGSLPAFLTLCAIICLGTSPVVAQNSLAHFQKILRDKVAFEETDFTALRQGQSVVKPAPVQDKREVAVCGLVSLQAPSEVFLQSYRESMARKTNAAILEIGSFSSMPTLADLQALTIENRDIEDLKECVVGDCRVKLSATMIERLRKEVNWEAADYPSQATQLLKLMLLNYVRDYLERGDVALIEYKDKPKEVRLAEEQRALMGASGYFNDVLPEFAQYVKGSSKLEMSVVENAIVWSKIKFGLKPVLAINHITIYKRAQETGPQVLIVSKQIYANHYFNSSLGLTAFVNIPGASPGSYLVYENRSRVDGLEGVFSKIKRSIVEDRARDGLTAILEHSRMNLNARALNRSESSQPVHGQRNWRRWTVGGVHLFLWLFVITAFVALFVLGNYDWRGSLTRGAHD